MSQKKSKSGKKRSGMSFAEKKAAEQRRGIPLILATDENYAVPLTVTLVSILENALPTTRYDIYILVDSVFSPENFDAILTLKSTYKNCNITFLPDDGRFDHAAVNEYFTKTSYYRLMIASRMPHLKKCIYLDCDIIVQKDLTELYSTDVSKHYLAGVKAAGIVADNIPNYHRVLGIPTTDLYVNAGVLVMNLTKIREDDIETKLMELTHRTDIKFLDQDILNIACFNMIKHLPPRYNLVKSYFPNQPDFVFGAETEILPEFIKCFGGIEMNKALKQNVVIHFLGKVKPWNDKNSTFATVWWKYHDLSPLKMKTEA